MFHNIIWLRNFYLKDLKAFPAISTVLLIAGLSWAEETNQASYPDGGRWIPFFSIKLKNFANLSWFAAEASSRFLTGLSVKKTVNMEPTLWTVIGIPAPAAPSFRPVSSVTDIFSRFLLKFYQYHASGHLNRKELTSILNKVKYKKLFPIHTENQELFRKIHEKTEIVEKGKSYKI